MQITMPYGHTALSGDAPWADHLATLEVAHTPALADVASVAREAFQHPIGGAPLQERIQRGESVAIIVSDSFRQTRIDEVLPELLRTLRSCGVQDEDILFVYSTGTHRGPTPDEERWILGSDVYEHLRGQTLTHNPFDPAGLIELGVTSRGTRVLLNRHVLERDRLIVTGTVVLHYFGGYGGGRKSILPGIAGVETIAQNHARNLHPTEDRLDSAVRIGALDGNPVAEDMFEGASLCHTDFLINTVLNRDGKIAGLFAGELDAAHRAAARFAHALYAVEIDELADLAVASAGAARNFIQSHKALFNAYQSVKPGGRIIFLAAAPEGFGGNKFSQWLSLGGRAAIIRELRKNAEINGQTALSTREKAAITLFVTELPAEEVALLGGRKADSLQEALDTAHAEFQAQNIPRPTLTLLPSASYTVPFPRSQFVSLA
ncbi:MAG: nickel-dependent lactate racemase [Candidatus Hydrogenedentes bacterium]|nr:nickel-dependent lactate racemase [Candidatus Hydrogenedentota bacterium]